VVLAGAPLGLGAGLGCQVAGCLVDGGGAEQCCRVADGEVLDGLSEGAWLGTGGLVGMRVQPLCRVGRWPLLGARGGGECPDAAENLA
jgi:hypothetical protein